MAVAVDVPPEQKRPRPGTTTTFTHMTAVTKLFRFEPLSGAVMVAAMVVALLIANSPLEALYNLVHHAPVHLRLGPLVIEKPLVLWINEGLMVLFFLVVGLEIKREFLEGHLSAPSQAALPFLAALGGMAIPAAIFVSINWNNETLLGSFAQRYVKRHGPAQEALKSAVYEGFVPPFELAITGRLLEVECRPNLGAFDRRSRTPRAG